MIRLTKIFVVVASLALVTAGCQSKTKFGSRSTTDYSVVSEGSASGVTSTISSPGETAPPLTASTPPLTGTNADTTTDFTIDTALQQMPANVGNDGVPVAPPPGTYQPGPTYVPPPPVRTTTPAPATSTGTITIHRPAQPRPAPPTQTMPPEPVPTETTGTSAPTDTTATHPEQPKKKVKPPEQPTQTDTSDTTDTVGTTTDTDTIGHQ